MSHVWKPGICSIWFSAPASEGSVSTGAMAPKPVTKDLLKAVKQRKAVPHPKGEGKAKASSATGGMPKLSAEALHELNMEGMSVKEKMQLLKSKKEG